MADPPMICGECTASDRFYIESKTCHVVCGMCGAYWELPLSTAYSRPPAKWRGRKLVGVLA